MLNTGHAISSTTSTVDPGDSKQDLFLDMDPNTRLKVNIMLNGFANTIISTIENGIVSNAGLSVIIIFRVEVLLT